MELFNFIVRFAIQIIPYLRFYFLLLLTSQQSPDLLRYLLLRCYNPVSDKEWEESNDQKTRRVQIKSLMLFYSWIGFEQTFSTLMFEKKRSLRKKTGESSFLFLSFTNQILMMTRLISVWKKYLKNMVRLYTFLIVALSPFWQVESKSKQIFVLEFRICLNTLL